MSKPGHENDYPQDDVRTFRSHAGEAITDLRNWPGYLLVVIGLISVGLTLTAAGGGFEGWVMIGAIVSVVCLAGGVGLVLLERRRVKNLEGKTLSEPGGH